MAVVEGSANEVETAVDPKIETDDGAVEVDAAEPNMEEPTVEPPKRDAPLTEGLPPKIELVGADGVNEKRLDEVLSAGVELAVFATVIPPNNDPDCGGARVPNSPPPPPEPGPALADETAEEEETLPKLLNGAAAEEDTPTELKADPAPAAAPPNGEVTCAGVESTGAPATKPGC